MITLIFSSSLLVISCIIFAIFVISKNPFSRTHQAFSAFLICVALGTLTDFIFLTPVSRVLPPNFWLNMAAIGICFSGGTYFHFMNNFIQKKNAKISISIHYISNILYAYLALHTDYFFKHTINQSTPQIKHGPLFYIVIIHCLLVTFYGTYQVILRFKNSTGHLHDQMKYFLLSIGNITLGMVLYTCINLLNIHIPRIENIFIIISFAILSYAIIKKNLLEIQIIITNTLALITSCIFFLSIIGAQLIWFHYHTSTPSLLSIMIISCINLVITALTFETIKTKIITTSQKLFLKGHYTTNDILFNISKNLHLAQTNSDILNLIANECRTSMELENVFLIFQNTESEWTLHNTLTGTHTIIPNTSTLLNEFKPTQTITAFASLQNLSTLNTLHYPISQKALVLPVFCSNTLHCVFIFNPKLSEASFTESDKTLLNAITLEVVAMFENVRKLESHTEKLSHLNTRLSIKAQQHEQMLNEKKRMDADLALAHTIQNRIIPKRTPKIQNYALEADFVPADILGGDFYSFLPFENGTIGIIVADAVGKGIRAALMMSHFKNLEEEHIHQNLSPKETITKLNHLIHNTTIYDNFLPLFYGVLDPKANTLTYCNAGMEWGLFYSQGAFQELRTDDPPLGLDPDITFEQKTITFHDSDILVLYSDGLTNAKNNDKHPYTIERTKTIIMNCIEKRLSIKSIHDEILKDWKNFRNPKDIDVDDTTLVTIEYDIPKIKYK